MTKASELIEQLQSEFSQFGELTVDGIKKAFEKRLTMFNMDDVNVAEVTIDAEGDVSVTFVDEENDELMVTFLVDDEDDTIVALIDDEEGSGDEDDEVLIIDLTPLSPPIKTVMGVGQAVDLANLEWMNKSTMMSILKAGEIGVDASEPHKKPKAMKTTDAFGNQYAHQMGDLGTFESLIEECLGDFEEWSVDEAGFARVVRGGKVVKLPLVRRKRKRILTGKQRQGIRKAALKRKAKSGQIARKRKRSLRIRGSRGIKKRTGNTSRFKVAGGADRKR